MKARWENTNRRRAGPTFWRCRVRPFFVLPGPTCLPMICGRFYNLVIAGLPAIECGQKSWPELIRTTDHSCSYYRPRCFYRCCCDVQWQSTSAWELVPGHRNALMSGPGSNDIRKISFSCPSPKGIIIRIYVRTKESSWAPSHIIGNVATLRISVFLN